MFKKIIAVVTSVVAASIIVGCSNSPVSVSEINNTESKTAALNSMLMQDVAAWGEHIWGLSTEPATGQGDYWIYYFNVNTNNWVYTWNYGKKISVTPDGKCYHFNSSNNIWWCQMNPDKQSWTNGMIPNPPQGGTMNDITAGVITGGSHSIWVIINDLYIYNYDGRYPLWVNKTDYYKTGYPKAIGSDPLCGASVAVISDQKGVVYYDGYSWTVKGQAGYFTDVGISGAWIIFPDCYGKLYKILGTTRSTLVSTGVARYGVGGDYDYYYYILRSGGDNRGYVQRGVNTWN